MNKLLPLFAIATIANLLTLLLYSNAATQPGGTGATMYFIFMEMPILWLIAIITAVVIAIRSRKTLFSGNIPKWTVLILLFCTPGPIWALYILTHPTPETLRSSSSTRTVNGKVYIAEYWYYTSNNKKYLTKYFIADSAKYSQFGETIYEKDSTWVYLSKTGDTIKIEKFGNPDLGR